MGLIKLETKINQTREICFDLCRSVNLHIDSAEKTNEKAIDGVTSGLMELGDEVVWEARHFGILWNLRVEINQFNRPNHFRDSQVTGIFKFFDHDHYFEEVDSITIMRDEFHFSCPLGPIGMIAEPIVKRHMQNFLAVRNKVIKKVAESNEFKKYIKR